MSYLFKFLVFSILSGLLLTSFNSEPIVYKTASNLIVSNNDLDPKLLFEQKCMICHTTENRTPENMIAPPFFQVKKRYMRTVSSKKDFVNTMTKWVLNPTEDKALMFGAVQKFKVMPKLAYNKEDIEIIAGYIYDNEMPKPSWFTGFQGNHKGKEFRK